MMRISSFRTLRPRAAAPGSRSRAGNGLFSKFALNGSVIRAVEVALSLFILLCIAGIIRQVGAPMPDAPSTVRPRPQSPMTATTGAVNPFRTAVAAEAPPTDETGDELADTTANLKLYGTWLDAEGGSAIVSGPEEKQIRVKPGDEIAPGVTLESVHREHVVILRSGVREALRLARGLERSGGTSAAPSATQPTASSGVAVPAGMRAVDNGGRGVNIVVEGGVDPQLLSSLGLEAGDVIVAIDSRPVGANVAKTFSMVRGKPTVPATIVRNGLTMTVELKVIDAMRLAAPRDTQALSEEIE